jgi:aminoglycoside phosphotransferase (APT) family kinase protein
MTAPRDEAVDLAALTRWMDDRQIERGPIEDVTSLQGGTQNVLLRFRRGRREFVLRPVGPIVHPFGSASKAGGGYARSVPF